MHGRHGRGRMERLKRRAGGIRIAPARPVAFGHAASSISDERERGAGATAARLALLQSAPGNPCRGWQMPRRFHARSSPFAPKANSMSG